MESGALIVRAFPFRYVGIWLFCMIGGLIGYLRFGNTIPLEVYVLFTVVFWGAFYCEYNRSVTWDSQGIRHRWRGRGYAFWEVIDEYIRMEDIQDITTDRWNGKWHTSKAFLNIGIHSADLDMYINPAYFKREEFEALLKYIHQTRPDVIFDEDAYAFMNGEFLISLQYKFSTMVELEKEGKMQIYRDGTCQNR
jgi:hypothetical protein